MMNNRSDIPDGRLKALVFWLEASLLYIEAFHRSQNLDDLKAFLKRWKSAISFMVESQLVVEQESNPSITAFLYAFLTNFKQCNSGQT